MFKPKLFITILVVTSAVALSLIVIAIGLMITPMSDVHEFLNRDIFGIKVGFVICATVGIGLVLINGLRNLARSGR